MGDEEKENWDGRKMQRVNTKIPQHLLAVIRSCQMPLDVDESTFSFGKYRLHNGESFLKSPLSRAFVNLKPLVAGHMLVIPDRIVPKFTDLQPAEIRDLTQLTTALAAVLKLKYWKHSASISMQDGAHAGQTVPHVHYHVIPRSEGDFKKEVDDAARIPRTVMQKLDEAFEMRKFILECILNNGAGSGSDRKP